MCFSIQVSLNGWSRGEISQILRQTAHFGPLELQPVEDCGDGKDPSVRICYPGDGCACRLLRADADWTEAFYVLDPGCIRSLENILQWLARKAGEQGFDLSASWTEDGDEPRSSSSAVTVSFDELIGEVREGRLFRGYSYRVSRS